MGLEELYITNDMKLLKKAIIELTVVVTIGCY